MSDEPALMPLVALAKAIARNEANEPVGHAATSCQEAIKIDETGENGPAGRTATEEAGTPAEEVETPPEADE